LRFCIRKALTVSNLLENRNKEFERAVSIFSENLDKSANPPFQYNSGFVPPLTHDVDDNTPLIALTHDVNENKRT
jgi:hypothetical protein